MAEELRDERREAAIRKVQEFQVGAAPLSPEQRAAVLAAFPEMTASDLVGIEAEAYYRSIR